MNLPALPEVDWSKFDTVAGPAAGASIALVGVLFGLIVTGARARRESRLGREDQLRNDQRQAIAQLLATAKSYQRLGEMLSEPARWAESGYERATALADSTDEAMSQFQQHLVTARLLIDESPLVNDLDAVLDANHAVAAVIHEAVNSFWEKRPPGAVVSEREARWEAFADAMANLQAHAIAQLRPTIRSRRRFRRH